MTETACDRCGSSFEQTGKRRFSTCPTCRYASRRTLSDSTKQCVKCGATFTPNKRKQEACSAACGGPKWRAMKTCEHCGTEFKPHTPRGRFCSHQCRADASRVEEPALGYPMITVPLGHPLLTEGQRRIFEHRAVLWEKYGPGPHPCYYCGIELDWLPGQSTRDGKITTEHLDRNRKNNHPDNLVVSCHGCNVRSSSHGIQPDELIVTTGAGRRVRGEQRPCPWCGEQFVVRVTVSRPDPCCSRSCGLKRAAVRRATSPPGQSRR